MGSILTIETRSKANKMPPSHTIEVALRPGIFYCPLLLRVLSSLD